MAPILIMTPPASPRAGDAPQRLHVLRDVAAAALEDQSIPTRTALAAIEIAARTSVAVAEDWRVSQDADLHVDVLEKAVDAAMQRRDYAIHAGQPWRELEAAYLRAANDAIQARNFSRSLRRRARAEAWYTMALDLLDEARRTRQPGPRAWLLHLAAAARWALAWELPAALNAWRYNREPIRFGRSA